MKVLLVDDHTSFCEGLIAAISVKRPEIQVTFESDAELVPPSLLGDSELDLIIIDVMMPGLGGVELVRLLNAMGSYIPILVMSSIDEARTVQEMFSLGILGFIPKYYSVEKIIDVIERCSNGEMHVPDEFRNHIRLPQQSEERRQADRSAGNSGSETNDCREKFKLTKRQVEILGLMDRGLSNQEMARVLHISLATVKTHIHHLYKIFNVNNRINCLRAAKNAKLR